MKLVKTILIVLEILLAVVSAISQDVNIGIRTGATYFTFENKELEEDATYTMGLDLAIPVEINLSRGFSIQPEIHFTQKGIQFENIIDGEISTFAVKTNYVELPILLKANYGSEKIKAYAFLAPSVGYAMNRFTVEQTGAGDKQKEAIGFIEGQGANSQRWEFSTIGGVGGSVKAGIGTLILDVRYTLGLTDLVKFDSEPPADWEKTTNRGCILSLGYMIPIGGK